jgi:hypothetical protein
MFSTMQRRHHFMSFPGRSKEEAIDQIYRSVAQDISRVSTLGLTFYLYRPHLAPTLRGPAEPRITINDLVTVLQQKYPHFVVQAIPAQRGILIDWS